MRAVILDSDARPVEDVVFGPGGMEANTMRRGRLNVVIRADTSAFARALAQTGRAMGKNFADSMRQVSLMGVASREQMEQLEAAILAQRQVGKSKPRKALDQLLWELRRFDVQIEEAVVAYGEWMLRTYNAAEAKLRSWWAILCR